MEKLEKFAEEIVEETLAQFEQLRNERKSLELQWRLNMNFLAGNQYCEISPMGDIEDFGKQYFWQEREIYNHIAPIIETRLAKLGRVKASVSVRPFSSDDSDVHVAKLSTQVLKAVSEENNLSQLLSLGNMWSEVCGSVFYKVIWNCDKGKELGKNRKKEVVREGDIDIIVCPPYEIFCDNVTNNSIENCKFIIHAKAISVEEIEDRWGVAVKGENIDIFEYGSVSCGGGLGYSATLPRIGNKKKENSAIVIEKFSMPTKSKPNGEHIIIAGDNLVYYGELPYITSPDGERGLPFVRQVALENVTNFYGTSLIERIIPLQRSYNSVKNRKHEFLNRIAMGVLAVEDGSIDLESVEDDGLSPGKVLVYRQGCNPPRMLDMGNVPSDFTLEESRLESEFVRITGVSELMRYSKLPENLTSGIAISLLQEQDDTRISVTAESIRSAVKRIGQLILRLYKQFATHKRIKRTAGDNSEIEVIYFKGSQLNTDDLVFDTDNELADTPASRKSMVMDLIKMGIMHDENGKINARTRVKVLEMLGFGNWENSKDIDECHLNKAIRENMDLRGAKADILEMDNHHIHIAEHTKALISDSNDTKYRQALIDHLSEHQKFLEESKFKESLYAGI